jgi:APA family basic amino acid/polyamine antiporter
MTEGTLKREVDVLGATMMGLGSMVGTGVFVSIGVAAGVIGPAVMLAIALAALVATCNALSSAQLAASMPVSGGTYEYGYAYLTPWLGFSAGWMFLCAKTASAATAALGFSGYLLQLAGLQSLVVPIAVAAVAALTAIVAMGIRRSNFTNIIIVSVTLFALGFFVLASLPGLRSDNWLPFFQPSRDDAPEWAAFLQAAALMFVAFTGYARIATLGEEMRDPTRNIPRAIIVTLIISSLIYIAVGAAAIGTVGADKLAEAAATEVAPLVIAAKTFDMPVAYWIVGIGAVTAMLGVALNLILGLSRMLLAMGRRRDMPALFADVNSSGSPMPAIIAVGIGIAALALIGNVETTWSFSAFTVLIYYAITNLAALRLPQEKRLYPRAVAWCGLLACLSLAFFVEREIWMAGIGLIAAGVIWHAIRQYLLRQP